MRVDLPGTSISPSSTSAASLGSTRAAAKNSGAAKSCPPEAMLVSTSVVGLPGAQVDLARGEVEARQLDPLLGDAEACARPRWLDARRQAIRPAGEGCMNWAHAFAAPFAGWTQAAGGTYTWPAQAGPEGERWRLR